MDNKGAASNRPGSVRRGSIWAKSHRWSLHSDPDRAITPLTAQARCCSSVVEHSLGKGEVDSSILSSSTIRIKRLAPSPQWGYPYSFAVRRLP